MLSITSPFYLPLSISLLSLIRSPSPFSISLYLLSPSSLLLCRFLKKSQSSVSDVDSGMSDVFEPIVGGVKILALPSCPEPLDWAPRPGSRLPEPESDPLCGPVSPEPLKGRYSDGLLALIRPDPGAYATGRQLRPPPPPVSVSTASWKGRRPTLTPCRLSHPPGPSTH